MQNVPVVEFLFFNAWCNIIPKCNACQQEPNKNVKYRILFCIFLFVF